MSENEDQLPNPGRERTLNQELLIADCMETEPLLTGSIDQGPVDYGSKCEDGQRGPLSSKGSSCPDPEASCRLHGGMKLCTITMLETLK